MAVDNMRQHTPINIKATIISCKKANHLPWSVFNRNFQHQTEAQVVFYEPEEPFAQRLCLNTILVDATTPGDPGTS